MFVENICFTGKQRAFNINAKSGQVGKICKPDKCMLIFQKVAFNVPREFEGWERKFQRSADSSFYMQKQGARYIIGKENPKKKTKFILCSAKV